MSELQHIVLALLRPDFLILTGSASIAARPLLNALVRRRFAAIELCAELPELTDLLAHLTVWCEAQGLPTALHWLAEEPESSSVAPTPCPGWLIHGNTCRAEALLHRNVFTAVRRNIRATAQRLGSLPDCGAGLVWLRSHQAAHRSGVAGSMLATAETQVDAWSTPNPAACVQVWQLRSAFDAEMVLASEPLELNAPWQREALAVAHSAFGYAGASAPGACGGVARAVAGALGRLRRGSGEAGVGGVVGVMRSRPCVDGNGIPFFLRPSYVGMHTYGYWFAFLAWGLGC